MDPNATLQEMRVLAATIADNGDEAAEVCGARLAELIEGLDTWICKGGVLPTRWQTGKYKELLERIEYLERDRYPLPEDFGETDVP